MKPEASAEARRWLAQAESDLAAARDLAQTRHFNVACFQAQQALCSAAASAPALAGLDDAAMRLDRLYIPTRYPNGLPGGIPADAFTAEDAAEAIAHAEAIFAAARSTIT